MGNLSEHNGGNFTERYRQYLLTRYTRGFLIEKLANNQEWLHIPGYLGLLMIDIAWFGSCAEAAKRCNGHPFSPSYVLNTDTCASCENNKEKVCSKIGSRIFIPGDKITSDAVICHINEMVSRNLISTKDGFECKKIAESNPIHGLAIAVRLAKNPVQNVETDLIQNLHNLGTEIEDAYISIFENEPSEQKEQKTMLYGPEMVVKINPRPDFQDINYVETLDKSTGMDGYLQRK